MKDPNDFYTNTGWWADKPEREIRPSSFQPLAGPFRARRNERVWTKAALMVSLMATFGWAVLRLAGM
ncbi:hypothetical protein [Variovorax sp. JS1663]|uniref:hypothetical protein n=1 Tax=Variovorax sp. JS1663 TaxID=1851577 RepID=UPI000B34977B|nr:hypothetical protein [Variovorax sp. JS1663]OUM03544.1 hypothetical protein A8M77_05680 [Variovorax sp. JS1663]